MRKILLLLVVIISTVTTYGQNMANKENVINQMNYCINSLTNIIHNKSMPVLDHESDQLVNNLTMEQIIGLYEINNFRTDLMDAIGRFGITEEERKIMRLIQSIKRDNMKWSALSNALNPTMLLTGNGPGFRPQMAFQTLLTAARSVVEYKTMQGEQNIEELQAMWDLRKEDLQTIIDLRKSAQGIIFELYNKYKLSENDRLTESTATLLNEYLTETDAAKRVRILQDNYKTYSKIPEYYYHLGMAYVDCNNYASAKQLFQVYLNMYNKAPILRYDERSGCIALTMLTYDKTLNAAEKEKLIETAINNLPSNSAAILQCAMVYIYELRNYEKGFQLLRAGLDDPKATDRDLLFMAAANLIPCLNANSKTYKAICDTFLNSQYISLDSYLTFQIYNHKDAWQYINDVLAFSEYTKRTWYTLWLGKKFKQSFCLTIPENISYDSNDILVYLEDHSDDMLTIRQLSPEYLNSISEDDINDVNCFKSNKNLKYLFVETIIPGTYKLKEDIDLEKIKDETYPRLSEFTLTEDDIEDIIDFCKDFETEDKNTKIEYAIPKKAPKTLVDIADQATGNNTLYNIIRPTLKKCLLEKVTFIGDTLAFKPYHSKAQNGYYIRIVLNNGLQVMYKYNEENKKLESYLYSTHKGTTYASSEAKVEYTSKTVVEEPSWFSKIWNSIFSSDDAEQEKQQKQDKQEVKEKKDTDDEPSWFSKTWNSIFSSNDEKDGEDKEIKNEEKATNKQQKSKKS